MTRPGGRTPLLAPSDERAPPTGAPRPHRRAPRDDHRTRSRDDRHRAGHPEDHQRRRPRHRAAERLAGPPAREVPGRRPAPRAPAASATSSSTAPSTRSTSSTSATEREVRRLLVLRGPHGPDAPHHRRRRLPAARSAPCSPITYDEMRKGCWDQNARLEDMDVNWIEASLSLPDLPPLLRPDLPEAKDRELALLCVQAYNDWMVEEWCGGAGGPPHPAVHRPAVGRRAGRRRGAPQRRPRRARRVLQRDPAITSACRRSTPATGSPSSRPAPTPTRSSTCTSARRRRCRPPRPTPPPACRPPSASTTPWARWPTASSPACWCATPTLKLAYSEGQIGWIPYILERADDVWKEFRGWAFDTDAVPEPPSTYFRRQVYACFFRDNFGLKNARRRRRRQRHLRDRLPALGLDLARHRGRSPRDMFADLDDDDRLQDRPRQRHQDAVARPGLSVRGGGYRCDGGPLLRSSSWHLRCLPAAVPDRPGLLDRRRARHRHRARDQRRPRRHGRTGARLAAWAGAWRS